MVRWLHQSIDLHLFVNKDPGRFLTLIDQPVPLGAWGTDSHLLIHECSCPGVDGDTSRETVKMRADTRITWKVIEGPGTFLSRNFRIDKEVSEGIWETPWYYPILDGIVDVKSKYLGKRVGKEVYFTQFGYGGSATGGQVIFQPPHLSPDQSVACKIQVTMAHADYTKDPEEHEQAQALLEMWITRRGEEYLYVYNKADDIQYGQGRHQPPDLKGVCRPRHHWRQLKGIHAKLTWVDPFDPEHGRTGLPPDVIYPNKVPVNDYVEIMLDQSDDYFGDMDLLQLDCTPTGEGPCKAPSHKELQLSDTLVLTWSSDRGDFPLLKARKEWESTHNLTKVVWHAPATPGDAQVKVRIADSSKEFLDEPIELTLDLQVEVDPNVPK